jgi:hypothetical protein
MTISILDNMDILELQAMALQKCELDMIDLLADFTLTVFEQPVKLKDAVERLDLGWEQKAA